MPKITKRLVDSAETRPAEYFLWDSDIPGLGLRILPSGRKSYVVQYRAERRSRRMTLGPSTVLTCTQARNRAIEIVAAAHNGQDPTADRDNRRAAVTVREMAERFDTEHIAIRLKPSAAKEYRRNLRRFILPALGQLTVTGITRADVVKFHHVLRHIPYQTNRCLEVISKMFNLAEMWACAPTAPIRASTSANTPRRGDQAEPAMEPGLRVRHVRCFAKVPHSDGDRRLLP